MEGGIEMYPFVLEELAWAITREREEEARKTRPSAVRRRVARLPFRSHLARQLVHAGVHLDRAAGESALKAAARGRC